MTGGVTCHMLPHLPGVPHLRVNRPRSAILKATETLGGAPVILWVRHHGIMKFLGHKEEN